MERHPTGDMATILALALVASGNLAVAGEDFGACCIAENVVCFETTSAHCEIEGGHWQGDGTTCIEGACLWACCLENGDCVQVIDIFECWNFGGVVEYGDCADEPCADNAPGACCFGDDICSIEMLVICELFGGEFQGAGTDCETVTCGPSPTGACCLPDGTCGPMWPDDCEQAGGEFSGEGTDCLDIDCSDLLGACCVDNHCDLRTAEACQLAEGDFYSEGSTCEQEDMDCDGVLNVPGEYSTIQEAIDMARFGETILVAPGTYTGDGDEVIALPSHRDLILRSSGGAGTTIIDGQNARRCVRIEGSPGNENDGTRIEGFTIRNGRAEKYPNKHGGGIECSASSISTIEDCTIENSSAEYGGGAYNSGTLILRDCTFRNNTAEKGGGGVSVSGNTQILGCTFENNKAISDTGTGGAIDFFSGTDAPALVNDCTFTGNIATFAGGAIGIYSKANVEIRLSSFHDNKTDGVGGAISMSEHYDGSVHETLIEDCSFTGNEADSRGGALSCNGANVLPKVRNCTFTLNQARSGGGVHIQACPSDSLFYKCTFTANQSTLSGGAAYNLIASPKYVLCDFDDNTANDQGGAVYNTSSNPTFEDCEFTGNSAETNDPSASKGGALSNTSSSPIFRFCIFKENEAEIGPMMHNGTGSNPTIYKCRINGNYVLGNRSVGEAGVLQSEETCLPAIEETIFCENEGGPDIVGPWDDLGGNDFPDSCPIPCLGDFDDSGARDINDLLLLLSEFSTDCSGGCQTDLDEDGDVDIDDMLAFIGVWGPCP